MELSGTDKTKIAPSGIKLQVLFGIRFVGSFFVCLFSFCAPEMERKMKKTEAKNTIGARIREMRLVAGMSQEQLADRLLTKKCTISLYENDKIDIKSSIILELAKALNCTGSYLLEGNKEMEADHNIMVLLSQLTDERVKEFALKQLEALTLLG